MEVWTADGVEEQLGVKREGEWRCGRRRRRWREGEGKSGGVDGGRSGGATGGKEEEEWRCGRTEWRSNWG